MPRLRQVRTGSARSDMRAHATVTITTSASAMRHGSTREIDEFRNGKAVDGCSMSNACGDATENRTFVCYQGEDDWIVMRLDARHYILLIPITAKMSSTFAFRSRGLPFLGVGGCFGRRLVSPVQEYPFDRQSRGDEIFARPEGWDSSALSFRRSLPRFGFSARVLRSPVVIRIESVVNFARARESATTTRENTSAHRERMIA